MRLPKILQPIVRKINKALNEWSKYGVKNNDVRYAESLLASFHESEHKKLKRDDRINARMKLDADAMLEYIDIIETIGNMDIYMGDIYDKGIMERFEKAQGKRGIDTLQDYINFIDDINTFKSENVISSILSWYQYNDLQWQNAKYGSMSDTELDHYILETYYDKGITHEPLYEFVLSNI